jgi:transposase
MHTMRSNNSKKVELLRQQLAARDAAIAERERIIAEKEEQLNERERVIAVRDAELYAKTLQIENLKAQLAVLRRSRYGRSSEKLDQEIEQLELLLGELEEGVAEGRTRAEQVATSPAAPRRDKRNSTPHGRKPLPEHLPREEIVHPPASSCTCCGGTVLRKVGTHRTEVLEYVPSSFKDDASYYTPCYGAWLKKRN